MSAAPEAKEVSLKGNASATGEVERGKRDGDADDSGNHGNVDNLPPSQLDVESKLRWRSQQRKREVLASVAVIALVLLWQEIA